MREKYYAFMALSMASFLVFGLGFMVAGLWSTFTLVLSFLPLACVAGYAISLKCPNCGHRILVRRGGTKYYSAGIPGKCPQCGQSLD